MIVNDHSRGDSAFFQLRLGGDRNFSYLLADRTTGAACAVDPGFDPEGLAEFAGQQELEIQRIVITHGHSDHVDGTARLVELTGATVHAGPEDEVPGAEPLIDNQEFRMGRHEIRALKTPGHSPGHFCFYCSGRLVTGDLLFCGKIGGTGPYFPGSSAEAEYASLQRLLELPDETGVFPGHDYFGGDGEMSCSTIGFERAHNPFLTAPDFAAFCALKENWAEYKKEHGIR